jgi:catechol 2,3-dioxygenase-like lactoylglutathione lyase family enzyme
MSTIDQSQEPLVTTDAKGRPVAYAQFHHNNFFTTRLTEMRDWYANVLGMKVIFEFPMACWMSNDGASHRLALTQLPGITVDADKRGHARLLHHAFEYVTFEDLNNTYLRLREDGIVPSACLDHGMSFSYYYYDPDENLVELQVDDFGDWTQSQGFMATSPAFASNPVGAAVDPAKVADAVAAGADFDEIRRRAWETDDLRPDAFPDLGGPPPGPDDPPMPIKW